MLRVKRAVDEHLRTNRGWGANTANVRSPALLHRDCVVNHHSVNIICNLNLIALLAAMGAREKFYFMRMKTKSSLE
jgi:hypothetical protein